MTTPEEAYRAVMRGRAFIQEVSDPQATPGVPRVVRQEALRVLRHFPVSEFGLIAAADVAVQRLTSDLPPAQGESGPQGGLAQDLENLLD